jgi:hypothetical protein
MSLNKVGGILSVGLDGINSPVTQVEYLVVAGGGSAGARRVGGYSGGGGGGAGGLLTATGYPVAMGTSITVTVGAGGAVNANGSNSVFQNITAIGGGYGAGQVSGYIAAASGGSGGGGQQTYATGGAGTAGQGNSGGSYGANDNGAGGGGAGSAGTTSTTNTCGNGGAGLVSSITGSPVQYAGGGGGGGYNSPPGGLGASGGGNGGLFVASASRSGTSGLNNTGGGGGANTVGGNGWPYGSTGGSGIVVIRYPSYMAPATSTTGGPEMYVVNGWRVYKFVASGTITF